METLNDEEIHYETYGLGALISEPDMRDYKAELTADAACTANFPDEFELSISAIKNQTGVGSCVAHAIAGTVEYFNKLQEGTNVTMSTNYIYGNRTNSTYTGKGMYVNDALSCLKKYGDVPVDLMPGNTEVPTVIDEFNSKAASLIADGYPNRISSYYRISTAASTRTDTIKAALMQNGPVIFVVNWYPYTLQGTEKMLNLIRTGNTATGSHCMYIYGWDQYGWKVANSWGTDWGIKGCCHYAFTEPFVELWGVTDDITTAKHETDHTACESALKAANEALQLEKNKYALLNTQYLSLKETIEADNETNTQNEETIKQLEAELETSKTNLEALNADLAKKQLELDTVNEELITIKKPFSSDIGKLIYKIALLFIKLFKKD